MIDHAELFVIDSLVQENGFGRYQQKKSLERVTFSMQKLKWRGEYACRF